MEKKDLTIIMPAYLEEENLRLLLPRVKEALAKLTSSFEIIVVDTERPLDGTPAACKENDVIYLNRQGSDSYGAAIRSGIGASTGKKVIFMDSDGSHYPEFIQQLYDERDSYDIIIASRYVEGGHTENKSMLIFMSKIVNWGYSIVLNIKCKDVSNSFKLYDGDTLRGLTLKCENFDIVEEILYKIIKGNKNIRIKEVPFSFKKRMFGDTKRNLPRFIVAYIFTLIRLRFFT